MSVTVSTARSSPCISAIVQNITAAIHSDPLIPVIEPALKTITIKHTMRKTVSNPTTSENSMRATDSRMRPPNVNLSE